MSKRSEDDFINFMINFIIIKYAYYVTLKNQKDLMYFNHFKVIFI